MRSVWLLPLLLASCASAEDAEEESEWQAYLAEMEKPMEPADPGRTPASFPPQWFSGPTAFYVAWHGSGTGAFPHRPTWRAMRQLERDLAARGLLRKGPPLEDPPAPDAAIDLLIQTARREHGPARSIALFILGDVPRGGSRPETVDKVLPAILGGLGDADAVVRASACYALGWLETKTADIARFLREKLHDPDVFVRHNAALSLSRMGYGSDRAVAVLREGLRHSSGWVAAGAAASLYRLGPAAKDAVPDLLGALRHETATVRRNAYSALEKIDPARLENNPDAEKVRKEIDSLVPGPAPPK